MRLRLWTAATLLAAASLLGGCGTTPGSSLLSGAKCLARLDDHNVSYRSLDSVSASDSRCEVNTPVRLSRAGAGLNTPVVLSCALAVRFDEFLREAVQPLAKDEFGQRVVRVNQLGAFSCRGINGSNHLSQHALGLAIDIAGFRLADGSTINVEKDWNEPGPRRDFLRHVANQACRYFSVVLTPDTNADHYNHLHLDLGPSRLCSV